MSIYDKNGSLASLARSTAVILELGCGPRKRYGGSIGIDAIDYDAVDVVGDAIDVLRAVPDGVAQLVSCHHFLEHVRDLDTMFDEMIRVVQPGGRIEIVVPYFAHPYFYSDPTHIRPFGLYTFSYLCRDRLFHRQVPAYSRRENVELRSADLIFKSTPPFYGRHAWKRLLGLVFNSCRYAKELYEESFAFIFPCYEIGFVLQKD